uniref:Uncharacterized protein n=1 Tax=Rhizophora mucronata TaxID=61149 RepID=A0A2P2QGY1_RHIMU
MAVMSSMRKGFPCSTLQPPLRVPNTTKILGLLVF